MQCCSKCSGSNSFKNKRHGPIRNPFDKMPPVLKTSLRDIYDEICSTTFQYFMRAFLLHSIAFLFHSITCLLHIHCISITFPLHFHCISYALHFHCISFPALLACINIIPCFILALTLFLVLTLFLAFALLYVCMCVCVYVCMCVCVYVCMCVCVYVCMCVYVYVPPRGMVRLGTHILDTKAMRASTSLLAYPSWWIIVAPK